MKKYHQGCIHEDDLNKSNARGTTKSSKSNSIMQNKGKIERKEELVGKRGNYNIGRYVSYSRNNSNGSKREERS